jgi:hypothetical protein
MGSLFGGQGAQMQQQGQDQGGTGMTGAGPMQGMGTTSPIAQLLSMLSQGGQQTAGQSEQQGQGGGLLSMLLSGGQNQGLNVPSQGGAAAPSPGTAQVGIQAPLFTQYGMPQIQGAQGAAGDIGGTQAGMDPSNYIMQQNGSGGQ